MRARAYWVGGFAALALAVAVWLNASCQTTCSKPKDCGAPDYCAMAAGTCISSMPVGFCQSTPDWCPSVSSPVCGCDGKTYENPCLAAQVGVSTAATGACVTPCGGASQPTCGAGQYCEYGDAGICPSATATGTCQPIPASCPSASSPVCGCTGVTYANACEASLAQDSVALVGACPDGGTTGGADASSTGGGAGDAGVSDAGN